jgi:hypothetical protein
MIKEPKQAGKFTESEIKELARLVSECKMTESDAAICLGRRPEHWQTWKSRHKRSASFATLIAHTRGKMVDGLISKIKSAGEDQEIVLPNGKVINKRGDWRAPAWLLEKTAPQFANQQQSAPAPITIQIGLIHDQLKRVIGFANEPLELDSVRTADNEPKRLESNLNKLKMPTRKIIKD